MSVVWVAINIVSVFLWGVNDLCNMKFSIGWQLLLFHNSAVWVAEQTSFQQFSVSVLDPAHTNERRDVHVYNFKPHTINAVVFCVRFEKMKNCFMRGRSVLSVKKVSLNETRSVFVCVDFFLLFCPESVFVEKKLFTEQL